MFVCFLPAVYSFSTRFKRFYLALASTAVTLLFIVIWPSAGGDNVSTKTATIICHRTS